MMEQKPESSWPADNPEAKDPLERHSYERCLSDQRYASENAAWFKWAHGEKKRRAEAELKQAQRETEIERANVRLFTREKADELTAQRRGTERAAQQKAQREAVSERLERGVVRW